MMTSSARQVEFADLASNPHSRDQGTHSAEIAGDARTAEEYNVQSTALRVPDFGSRGEVYATTARLAGRLNAASISEEEHTALLEERQLLLDKVFDGTISRKEEIRLDYVRWSLDRIEDAKHGSVPGYTGRRRRSV